MQKFILKFIIIILQIFLLYAISYLGSCIVKLLHIPLPGSIVGLLILLLLLHLKIIRPQFIEKGAGFLLPILTLLFIPATVGVINFPELVSLYGLLLLLITVISTLFALGFTGIIARKIETNESINIGVEKDA